MNEPREEPAASRSPLLTRRAALAGAGGVVVAAAGVKLAWPGDGDQAPAKVPRRIRGMYSQRAVNVCYSPMIVVAGEALARQRGREGVYLRKGPSFDAEPTVLKTGVEVLINQDAHIGRQSKRRAEGPGCGVVAPRPDVGGWVWCYDQTTRKSGWAPVEVDGTRYIRDEPEWDGLLNGPNDKDYDCRFPRRSQAKIGYDCDKGGPIGDLIDSKRRKMVVADFGSRIKNNQEDFYLRWALGSVAFQWLKPGDRVTELYHRQGISYAKYIVQWSFVEVQQSPYTPKGTRGWILQSGLGPA